MLDEPNLPRSSLSESIRQGHGHLLVGDALEDLEESRRNLPHHGDFHPQQTLMGSSEYDSNYASPGGRFGNETRTDDNEGPGAVGPNGTKNVVPHHRELDATKSPAAEGLSHVFDFWNPFWLRKTVLIAFIILFACMLIVLGLLYHLAEVNHGISTQVSQNRYSWTYGPTALFIVVVSLWRQVDYWCKALLPWQAMRGRPVSAQKSLLLDYISPDPVTTVWLAIKHGHWLVLASTGGLFLLKLITVASTALLALQPTTMSKKDFPFNVTKTLDSRNFDGSTSNDLDKVSSFVLNYYSILEKGLQYQTGTLAEMAYEPIVPAIDPPSNATYTVDTVGFFPDLVCEEAKVNATLPPHNGSTIMDKGYQFSLTFNSPGCRYDLVTDRLCDPHWQSCPSRILSPLIDTIPSCGGSNDEYLYFLMMDARYQQSGYDSTTGGYTTWSSSIAKMTSIICHGDYTTKPIRIQRNPQLLPSAGGLNYTLIPGPVRKIQHFSNYNLTAGVMNGMQGAPLIYGPDDGPNYTFEYQGLGNMIMSNFMMSANDHSDLSPFLDDIQVLTNTAQKVFKGLASQLVGSSVLVGDPTQTSGKLDYVENRLHVKALSVWLMGVGLVLLILVGLVCLLWRPQDVVPIDPTSIGAVSTFLAPSFDLEFSLRDTGAARMRQIRSLLSHSSLECIATSNPRTNFYVDMQDLSQKKIQERRKLYDDSDWKYYRPISVRYAFLILAVILPIALIVALEIVQQISDRKHGFVNIGPETIFVSLAHYIPAAVMILFGTLVGAMSSNFRILAPFVQLRKGSASASHSILSNLNRKVAPFDLVDAIRSHHFGVFFATIAASLASILTIIVSGLYVRETLDRTYAVSVDRSDYFDLSWNNSVSGDSNAATVLTMVLNSGLSYPQWTFGELAFPTYNLPIGNDTVTSIVSHAPSTPMSLQVPTMRGTLACTKVPYDNINTKLSPGSIWGAEAVIATRIPLPKNCHLGGSGRNLSYVDVGTIFDALSADGLWAYGGKLQDLHVGDDRSSFESAIEDNSANTDESYIYNQNQNQRQQDNPRDSGCPSLVFTYGKYQSPFNQSEHTTVLVCNQVVEELQTNATFLLPDMIIDTNNPPKSNEASANPVGKTGEHPFGHVQEYRIEQDISSTLISLKWNQYKGSQALNFDNWFQVLLFPPDTDIIDPDTFAGPENVERLTDAIQHLYRLFMAQVLNTKLLRKSLPKSKDSGFTSSSPPSSPVTSPTVTAYITDSTPLRLKQDKGSKIVLQVLLGVILVCGIIAHIFQSPFGRTGMRNLVTHNPFSLAGTMSLLAGSEIIERIALAQKERDHHDARGFSVGGIYNNWKDIFDGYVFSMGWWDHQGNAIAGNDSEGGLKSPTGVRRRRVNKKFGIDLGRADG